MPCKIKNDNLIFPCEGQPSKNGSVCYKNKCNKIIKLLSEGKEYDGGESAYGTVAILENELVSKWNKLNKLGYDPNLQKEVTKRSIEESIHELLKEMHIQKKMSNIYHLAPRIHETYGYRKSEPYLNARYIMMENLIKQGYTTMSELFGHSYSKPASDAVIIEFIKTMIKLHKSGIAHRDLHAKNVFYNPTTKKVKFIDFGLAYNIFEDKYFKKEVDKLYNPRFLSLRRRSKNPKDVISKNYNKLAQLIEYATNNMEHAVRLGIKGNWPNEVDMYLILTYNKYVSKHAKKGDLNDMIQKAREAVKLDVNYHLLDNHASYLKSLNYNTVYRYFNLSRYDLDLRLFKDGFPQINYR